MQEPTVAVISLGGTISCLPEEDTAGVVPALGAADLVENLAAAAQLPSVITRTWSTRDSSEITFDELIDLATEVRRQYADGVRGVIITQGTDTIEETAYALDLLLGDDHPVVVTGAMRDASRPGSDGMANLGAALLVAARDELREIGSVVVFDHQIHAARWVRKTHTTQLGAFQSPGLGPLGWITEDHPNFVLKPFRRPADPITARKADRRVLLLTAQMDDHPQIIDFIASSGYSGAVIAGMGGGHVDGAFSESLGALAQNIPVVFTSRTGAGEVLQKTYGSPGAEIDLINRGLIPAGSLDDLKARILLTLLVRSDADIEAIKTAFADHGHYSHRRRTLQGL